MEEANNREDTQANLFKQVPILPAGTLKSTLSRSSTPRSSPTYRKLRTPRREFKGGLLNVQWLRGNRLIFWLLLISLWAYIGFHIQSRWVHNEHNKAEFIGYRSVRTTHTVDNVTILVDTLVDSAIESRDQLLNGKEEPVSKMIDVNMISRTVFPSRPIATSKKNGKTKRRLRSRSRGRGRLNVESANETDTYFDEGIPRGNTSYGLLVGPFGKIEDAVLDWSIEKRKVSCDRKSEFADIVWSRKFVLIFHELSMTGAPLSMMELATEILSCGGKVSVVVLTRRGGLMGELNRRRIKVLEDKGKLSYKTAMRADLIIAGSAVCSSWIEQYLAYSTAGSSQILWWIMENRREYFDRAKRMLNQVTKLAFLSDAQSKQWLSWCQDERIQLKTKPAIVPLSVNDELAVVAGFPYSHNTTLFTAEKMLAKRNLMRVAVRKEMGIADDDMLVMSLSSINPAKGQLLLLESLSSMVGQNIPKIDFNISSFMGNRNETGVSFQVKHNWHRGMLPQKKINHDDRLGDILLPMNDTRSAVIKIRSKHPKLTRLYQVAASDKSPRHLDPHLSRNLLSSDENRKEPAIKLLIGSVGSKSNKTPYVKEILKFLTLHSNLSKSLLLTPATTHVASLYTAADVYVINAQGIGETFGRVTIEAMAFGLPVLGTDAGGTREIVEDRVTGLLHPIGREGVKPLAQNLRFLLHNPSARKQLGDNGRLKVEKMYLKQHMYQKLAEVFLQCLKTN